MPGLPFQPSQARAAQAMGTAMAQVGPVRHRTTGCRMSRESTAGLAGRQAGSLAGAVKFAKQG